MSRRGAQMGVLSLALFAVACDSPRQPTLETEDDAAAADGGRDLGVPRDAGPRDAAPDALAPGTDSAPTDATPVDAHPDAATDAETTVDFGEALDADLFGPPDWGEPVEEICNGEDDDLDGRIDEGVMNACGGCGDVPPGGCQAWRVDVTQGADGTVNPDRVVGLLGGVDRALVRALPGATCRVTSVAPVGEGAHLGAVQVRSPRLTLDLLPEHDAARHTMRYAANPSPGPVQVHAPGERVDVDIEGGEVVGSLALSTDAPAALEGVDEASLRAVVDRVRGRTAGRTLVRWAPAEPVRGERLRFFIGGSLPLFTNIYYRAIEHFQLDAVVRDDGRLELPAELLGEGLPESAVWVYLTRQAVVRRTLAENVVELVVGQRAETRISGRLENDQRPPLSILEPSPNERRVVPGAPLRVRWSPVPSGVGPLTVSLNTSDAARGWQQQVSCVVDDPNAGTLELPADFTAAWPTGRDDLRQLGLTWELERRALAPPDDGEFSRTLTVLLRLDGCADDAECDPGSVCASGACRPGCRRDADCPVGICDPDALTCR